VGGNLLAQKKAPPKDSPNLLLPPSEDILRAWNDVGGKLIDMAQDFPENKYDFKVQKDQRTFAENILHVSGGMFQAASAIKGTKIGPAFDELQGPSRANYKTKADVVKLIKDAVAAGAAVIKTQGHAGLNNPFFPPSPPTQFARQPSGGPSSRKRVNITASSSCITARIIWFPRRRDERRPFGFSGGAIL